MEENKITRKRSVLFAISLILIIVLLIVALSTRITIKEGENYHTKNEVALYIYTYKELPPNYHEKAYYSNDSIQPSNGEYIGGDIFQYRGTITKYTNKKNLRECDIEYPTTNQARGTNRLVYTTTGSEVFYTNTHYQDFEKISWFEINLLSNICIILMSVIAFANITYILIVIYKNKDAHIKEDLKNTPKQIPKVIFGILCTPFIMIGTIFYGVYKVFAKKQK